MALVLVVAYTIRHHWGQAFPVTAKNKRTEEFFRVKIKSQNPGNPGVSAVAVEFFKNLNPMPDLWRTQSANLPICHSANLFLKPRRTKELKGFFE
jgi:hypothetical protein